MGKRKGFSQLLTDETFEGRGRRLEGARVVSLLILDESVERFLPVVKGVGGFSRPFFDEVLARQDRSTDRAYQMVFCSAHIDARCAVLGDRARQYC